MSGLVGKMVVGMMVGAVTAQTDMLAGLHRRLEPQFVMDRGRPRQRLARGLIDVITDECPNVQQAVEILWNVFVPFDARENRRLYVPYTTMRAGRIQAEVLQHREKWDTERRRSRIVPVPPPHIAEPQRLLRLLLGLDGLAVNWSRTANHDTLFIDVDYYDDSTDDHVEFDRLPPELRAELMSPMVAAIAAVSSDIGAELKPMYYSSGNSGVWLAIPLEDAVSKERAGDTVEMVIDRIDEIGPERMGIYYLLENGNRFANNVRVPFSIHHETGRYSLLIDPMTGEYHDDQLDALLRTELRNPIIPLELVGSNTASREPVLAAAPLRGGAAKVSPIYEVDGGDFRATDDDFGGADGPYPWSNLLPREISPTETHSTLIGQGVLSRVMARLSRLGIVGRDGKWVPELDDLVQDIMDRFTTKPQRQGQVRAYIRSDLRAIASGTFDGYDVGLISGDDIEQCRELATQIIERHPKLVAQDVETIVINLLVSHRLSVLNRRPLFFTRATMAKFCGFVEADASFGVADNAGRRVGRIVERITEHSPKCTIPLLRRLTVGHTGLASTYELIPEAWGDLLGAAA